MCMDSWFHQDERHTLKMLLKCIWASLREFAKPAVRYQKEFVPLRRRQY